MTVFVIPIKNNFSIDIAVIVSVCRKRGRIPQSSGIYRRVLLYGLDHKTGSGINGTFTHAFHVHAKFCNLCNVFVKAVKVNLRHIPTPIRNGYNPCPLQTESS